MTDTNFPLTADSDFDDLPRTLRREKEARAREAREARDRHEREKVTMDASRGQAPSHLARTRPVPMMYGDDPVAASVQRFDVPFFHLAAFFLKAVLAAIPAMILLGALLYCAGKGIETFYPELLRMKIMVAFPSG